MIEVQFVFAPQDYVRVSFNELNYRGRVIRCTYDGGQHLYKVIYSDDKGDIKSDEFYEDEIGLIERKRA